MKMTGSKPFLRLDERGLESLEYLLIAATVIIAAVGAWRLFGSLLGGQVRNVGGTVDSTVRVATTDSSRDKDLADSAALRSPATDVAGVSSANAENTLQPEPNGKTPEGSYPHSKPITYAPETRVVVEPGVETSAGDSPPQASPPAPPPQAMNRNAGDAPQPRSRNSTAGATTTATGERRNVKEGETTRPSAKKDVPPASRTSRSAPEAEKPAQAAPPEPLDAGRLITAALALIFVTAAAALLYLSVGRRARDKPTPSQPALAALPPAGPTEIFVLLTSGRVVCGTVSRSSTDGLVISTASDGNAEIVETITAAEITGWVPAQTRRGREAYSAWLSELLPQQFDEAKRAWSAVLAARPIQAEPPPNCDLIIPRDKRFPKLEYGVRASGKQFFLFAKPTSPDLGSGWEMDAAGKIFALEHRFTPLDT